MSEFKDLIGKRVLVNDPSFYIIRQPIEVQVLEVSPSNRWVKLLYLSGHTEWEKISEFKIIEVLK